MSNKFARKLAKYLAIILAAAMIAGLFFMFLRMVKLTKRLKAKSEMKRNLISRRLQTNTSTKLRNL